MSHQSSALTFLSDLDPDLYRITPYVRNLMTLHTAWSTSDRTLGLAGPLPHAVLIRTLRSLSCREEAPYHVVR